MYPAMCGRSRSLKVIRYDTDRSVTYDYEFLVLTFRIVIILFRFKEYLAENCEFF